MYLRHVTLMTGHIRDSERSEISDEALAVCRAILDAPESPLAMAGPLYRLTVERSSRCALCAVWQGETRLVTIGIATHSRCGASLWRRLVASAITPIAASIDPERAPAEPWVAARIEGGLALYPEAAKWLGDLERCLGWALADG